MITESKEDAQGTIPLTFKTRVALPKFKSEIPGVYVVVKILESPNVPSPVVDQKAELKFEADAEREALVFEQIVSSYPALAVAFI